MPPSDNDPTKNRGPKPGGAGKPGPRTDGPILDLTAKRVGEAAPAGSASGKPSDPKPSDPKPSDVKPFGAGSSEPPKPAATGPSVSTGPSVPRPPEPGPSASMKAGETKPAGIAPVGSNASGPSTSVPNTAGPNISGAKPADTAAPRLGAAAAAVAASPTVSTPAKPEPAGATSSATPIRPSPSVAPADAKAPGTTGSREQAAPPPGLGTGPGRAATSVPPVEKPHANKTADRPLAPPARRGGLGALAAGLLGGVVGAGLLYGLQSLAPARTGGADPRVAALESRLDALASKDAPAPNDALAALTARVAAAEGRLGPLADAAKSAGDEARAAREAAGRAPAAAPPDTARLDALAGRLDGLDNAVKALPSGETVRGAEQRVAALEEQGRTRAQALAALEGRAASAGEAAAANGRRLDEQAALGSALGGRVEALTRDVAGRAEASRLQAGLRVVAADRVATALALGQPYAEALGALKGLDASQATGNLAMLEAYAAGGAPTVQGLARDFRPLAERIEAGQRETAQRGVAATGSLTDRLASMAGSIVSVRRVGDAPVAAGPNPLSRVQAALDRGDLADAAKAWDALPDGARAASAEFGASLKRRAAADEAARAISTAALAALGR